MIRRGDLRAYVVLYERHVGVARRLARSLLRNQADADDVVSEVFASVLAVIQRGKGPRDGFAAYLTTSIRHECYRVRRHHGRTTQITTTGDRVTSDVREVEDDPFARRDEADVLQQALQSLSPQSRELLWRTEVEGQSHQEIAELKGSTPQAVAAQALRARRALGGAYLQSHLAAVTPAGESVSPACVDTRRHLADLVRGSLGIRRRRRIESHLRGCLACRHARDDLGRLNQHLRTAPGLPIAAAIGLRARILGWLARASAPLGATTGLIIVSTVVPLVVANRSNDNERVAAVAAPAAEPAAAEPVVHERSAQRAATVTTGATVVDKQSERRARTDTTARRAPSTTAPRRSKAAERPGERGTTAPVAPPATTAPAGLPAASSPPLPSSAPPTAEPVVSTPNITVLPSVSLPPISLPEVSLPEIAVPGISTPTVSLPPVSVPLVTVPSVTVPSVSVPSITVPSITVPSITVPSITVPSITVPPITLPPIGG